VPRPRCCRRVAGLPRCLVFKPAGVPASAVEEVVLGVDELEAIRLADLSGLYQEEAAAQMNVSRQTFGRIIEAAHKKVAQALIEGKALRIEGGTIEVTEMRAFKCDACEFAWELPFGTGRPEACPKCKSAVFHRVPGSQGPGRGCGRGLGPCARRARPAGSGSTEN
jgi:uncharacterized protein